MVPHDHSNRTGKSQSKILAGAVVSVVFVVAVLVWLAVVPVIIAEGLRTFTVRFVPSTDRARRGVVVSVLRHGRQGCEAYDLGRADGVLVGNEVVGGVDQRVSWKASPLRGRYDRTYSDEDHVCAALIYLDGTVCLYEAQLSQAAFGAEATFTEGWPCAKRVDDGDFAPDIEREFSRLGAARQLPNSGLQSDGPRHE
jgi:hypothetical protein